jgi:selenide, water dikinase
VLVDTRTSDDAGVYQLTDELALVQTVDFFTPLVDDPYLWGAIAATNALSDVYAMGGRPVTALNIAALPLNELSPEVVAAVMRGGHDKCAEAGVAVLGGHTVEDPQPKFGLSVTGVVHPKRILTNAGAQQGDKLVLTKPLGVGMISSGTKKGLTPPDLYERAVASMLTLNRAAAEAMNEVGVHAATDVTGFGLLGHLSEMCIGSGLGACIVTHDVPVFDGVEAVRRAGAATRCPRQVYAHLGERVQVAPEVSEFCREVLADPQTSGGLLIAVAPERLEALLESLKAHGVQTRAVIGQLEAGSVIRVI